MAADEQFIIDSKGKKTGVILSLKRYQQLIEDLHDLAIIAERKAEKTISLKEVKRQLKAGEKQPAVASVRRPREGWDEAFKRMHELGQDRLLDDPLPPTDFDEHEWEW